MVIEKGNYYCNITMSNIKLLIVITNINSNTITLVLPITDL